MGIAFVPETNHHTFTSIRPYASTHYKRQFDAIIFGFGGTLVEYASPDKPLVNMPKLLLQLNGRVQIIVASTRDLGAIEESMKRIFKQTRCCSCQDRETVINCLREEGIPSGRILVCRDRKTVIKCLREIKIPSGRILVVDDSPRNLTGAVEADRQVKVIGIGGSSHNASSLRQDCFRQDPTWPLAENAEDLAAYLGIDLAEE